MWFVDSKNQFQKSSDPKVISLESMIQELQLWLGENPMDITNGVDYMGVFENRVFLKSSIENVLQKYRSNYDILEIKDYETNSSNELISVNISIVTKDGEALLRSINVGS